MTLRRWPLILIATLSIIWATIASAAAAAAGAPYVVILLIDGARSDLVHELAAQGKLPNIQKLFLDEGLDVTRGLTVFPTTSTNAYQSFMTGLFPGHAGIPYLARFSRSEKESIEYLSLKGVKIMNADLLNWYQLNDPSTPYQVSQGSLFDHLAGLRTASIYATFYRDATVQAPRLPFRAAWDTFVLGDHETLDILAYNELKRIYEGPVDKVPHLSLVALLAIDILAHQEGARAPRLMEHFVTLDRMVGDFWALLQQRGLAEKTYLVLVGDHGNHDISERSYLRERLIREGVAIRSRHMRPPYELAINARGVSCAIIAVAGQDGWKSSPTLENLRHVPTRKGKELDLVAYLRNQPETDLLLIRDGNHHVRVFNQTGEAEITRVWSGGRYWYSYRVLNDTDPLRYINDPALKPFIADNTPLTAAQWLPLTADKEYGDAIVQIGQIFTDGRAGDMMIVPKHNWVFRHEKANTHGGLSQEDIHIPIMMRGPGIAPQKIPHGRSVDVMPTILSWFGRTAPHRDGQDLLAPDPAPGRAEAELARQEVRLLSGHGVSGKGLSKPHLEAEYTERQGRLNKLAALAERCTGHRPRPEERLTRSDRPKKIRVSTCEVVDLAAKTAYEDLQRLSTLREKPDAMTHASHPSTHATDHPL